MSDPRSVLSSPDFRARLDECIRCGLCLPACPTYEVARTEMEAPRGRIALMRAAADGRVDAGGAFREHLDSCLGCRSCETACPSGVRYGALLERAREAIEAERPRSRFERFARWLALRQLLPHRRRLRALASLARAAQALGLIGLARKELLPVTPKGGKRNLLRRAVALAPPLDGGRPADRRPAPALGEKRGTVALFRGCVQDAFLGRVNAATVRVLQRNGFEVHFPAGETCCGAAALHLGETELARELARRNVEAFDAGDCHPEGGRAEYLALVSNAGGCGALLKEYPRLLEGVAESEAGRFAAKVRDAGEFLAENLHVAPDAVVAGRATYADSCHLRHAQGVAAAPRELLARVPGLELVELERPEHCCGSAGVYNLVRPEDADRVLDLKMKDVAATGAGVVVVTNPGCQLQLEAGVRRAGLDAEVLHLMELLDRAYGGRQHA